MIVNWFRAKPPRETGRLTETAACAIAADMVDDFHRDAMTRASLERRGGALVWIVTSSTIGSGAQVTLDDATGAVLEVGRWGVR